MSELEIGKVIYKLRKDNRKTQEELASFLSVSTAAVSKWERGTTYPDITLLPKIAVYFDISMDELFNYNKDLSDDEVMKISKECELKFAELEWEEWVAYCKNYLKRYPNSCLLKFRIAYLFVKYDPIASITASDAKFSDAISSIPSCSLSSSFSTKL